MVVAAVAAALLSACGGSSPPTATPTGPAIATEISSELLAPLEGLGPCVPRPADSQATADVVGLYLPEGAVIDRVSPQGPITQVEGWMPLTPIQIRAHYVTRDDVEVLAVEDEVWESETLLTDGDHRLFVKASGICRTESVFVAIVSPEDGSAPEPLGQQQ